MESCSTEETSAGLGWGPLCVGLHAGVLIFGAVLVGLLLIALLLPATSPLMVAVGRLHLHDKVQQFCAYLAFASVPVNESGDPQKTTRGEPLDARARPFARRRQHYAYARHQPRAGNTHENLRPLRRYRTASVGMPEKRRFC